MRKRQRPVEGVEERVLSVTARGLRTGEVAAHFAEVYGTSVSKDTISQITEKVTARWPSGGPAPWAASAR